MTKKKWTGGHRVEMKCDECGQPFMASPGREHSICRPCIHSRVSNEMHGEVEQSIESNRKIRRMERGIEQETLMPWQKPNFKSMWDRE